MKRLLLVILACASHVFAGAGVRVNVVAEGDGSGLILQAYTACLRNTPGVQVVPLGQSAEVTIAITSILARNQIGETGYVWAMVAVNPGNKVLLEGPEVATAGRTYPTILRQVASSVQTLDRNVLMSLRR
jgi:hypothetical protein